MKVYVVQKGHYSDMHIIAVTENKETANEIAKAACNKGWIAGPDTYVEEYDTKQFETGIVKFDVDLWEDAFIDNEDIDIDEQVEYVDYDLYEEYTENTRMSKGRYIIFAKSKEQALKIAQDMEAEYKAIEAGIC